MLKVCQQIKALVVATVAYLFSIVDSLWKALVSRSLLGRSQGQSRIADNDSIFSVHGIGAAWPSTCYGPAAIEDWICSRYDASAPGIQKLLRINLNTGIESRGLVAPAQPAWIDRGSPPSMLDCDRVFKIYGVQFAIDACKQALGEWGGAFDSITHTVAVTCTNAGSPGFDLDVVMSLGLPVNVERTLLHGVGCAGGMSLVREVAQIAQAATLRNEPARILMFASEVGSLSTHMELEAAEHDPDISVGSLIFSDGAAALVICNKLAANEPGTSSPIYELLGRTTSRVPDSAQLMSFLPTDQGFKLVLSRAVATRTATAVVPSLERLFAKLPSSMSRRPDGFDWALHPGGLAIIEGVEKGLDLSKDHLRASRHVYKNHGNTSSVGVLAVLNQLRHMGEGREHVLAVSFGPGLLVEMGMFRRIKA